MPDFVYNNARVQFARKNWDWLALPVNAALLTADYTPLSSHVNISDVNPSAIVVRDKALVGLGVTSYGAVYGAIPQFLSLISSSPVAAILLYSLGANDNISPLIYYSSGGLGFPFAPSSLNWNVGYDATNGGWFQV